MLLFAGAIVPCPSLRDAVTLAPADRVHLELPPLYVALAPIFGVMDVLACLTLTQQIALVLTLGVVVGAGWPSRSHSLVRPRTRLGAALLFAVGLLAYAEAMLLWDRPMARLRAEDPDEVVVDFHSHTQDSHDGRPGFDDERNRTWHALAGFNVAYVTDHHAWRRHPNPTNAGEGTLLLTGAELRLAKTFVVALDDPTRYLEVLDKRHTTVIPGRLEGLAPALRPGLVLPLPMRTDRAERAWREASGGVIALEVRDGDPRAIEQSRREHDDLLRLADHLDVALVSGTNLHGWGRTASAWTLLRIPGWGGMPPDQIAAAIEDVLRRRSPGAVRVVERVVADPGSSTFARLLALPLVAVSLIRALQPWERASWLVWIWAPALVMRARHLRNRGARTVEAGRGRA